MRPPVPAGAWLLPSSADVLEGPAKGTTVILRRALPPEPADMASSRPLRSLTAPTTRLVAPRSRLGSR